MFERQYFDRVTAAHPKTAVFLPLPTTVGLLIALFGLPALTLLEARQAVQPGPEFGAVVAAMIWLLLIALVLGWERRSLQSIGWRPLGLGTILLGLLSGLLITPLFPILQALLRKAGIAQLPHNQDSITSLSISVRIFIVLTAGLVEESFYRGYLIERLTELTGRPWVGFAISTLSFAIIDTMSRPVSFFIFAILISAYFTALYFRTRNLPFCVAAHCACDAMGFIVVPLLHHKAA